MTDAPYPHKILRAAFTTDEVIVDGIADEAYSKAEKSPIRNVKDGREPSDYSGNTTTGGTVRSLWDGRTLYIFVDVTDSTPAYNGAYRGMSKEVPIGDGDSFDFGNPGGGFKSGTYSKGDAVEFSLDFWNDKTAKFQDDDGLFSITRDGYLTFYKEPMIKNHSSVHADRENREFSNRIKAWAAREKEDGSGYCVELALELYAWDWEYDENGFLKPFECPIKNGNRYGLDIMIGDAPGDDCDRTVRVYWSHRDNSLPFSSRDFNADWGEIELTGWKGESFRFNNWNLLNAISYVQSDSLQKGVWSPETQRELDEALYNAVAAAGSENRDEADAAAARLIKAVCALRRVKGKYPDPLDLRACFTLPNPYEFFDGRPVRTREDWRERRREILDMAQYYEYGCKPPPPDCLRIDGVSYTRESVFDWAAMDSRDISYFRVDVTVAYGDNSASTHFRLFLPEKERAEAAGRRGPLPVVLGFEAVVDEYLEAGFAVLGIPAGDITDDRNTPWSGRAGFMRSFFPYDRTSVNEISNEMAAAWECSIAIDALEKMVAEKTVIEDYGTADRVLAAGKLAVTGFSIFGKYAFVSALFDERISVCVPSAAGCTGPSLYRYVINYKDGFKWSWGVTTGGEVMADTVRHNPGRTIELFRRFLVPGRLYKTFGDNAGYGERLPYDHEELVATLAPRAIVLQSTIDDYANQSVGDALSLTLAKTIYASLGYDKDMLVMFNYRDGTDHGPAAHGEDGVQRTRTAEYLNWYFYGTKISEETLKKLQTDPFYNDIIDGKDGYTRNMGGLEKIAPWLGSAGILE